MAYIGRPLNAGNLAVQSGTGDGSDTTPIATLDYSVGSSNSIAVYLDGVRQLAGTDFTAAGTTLTFTTAPASGVGVDVYFLGLELSIPTPADDTVTGAKIVDNAIDSEHYTDGSIDLAHMSSESVDEDNLHISNAGSNGQFLSKQSGNAGGLTWASSGASDVKFLAQPSGLLSNVTGNSTIYSVVFATERFDTGSDFDGTSTFTAPETGKYLLHAHLMISGVTTNVTRTDLMIVTSNATYTTQTAPADPGSQIDPMFTVIADMDASDTAIVKIYATGEGSDTWDINSGGFSHFCGALLA